MTRDEYAAQLARAEAKVEELESIVALQAASLSHLRRNVSLNLRAIGDLAHAPSPSGLLRTKELSVAVVLPTCDRRALLERALRSLRDQSRRPDAIYLVNDGLESCDAIAEAFVDLNIVLLKTTNPFSGASSARNCALMTAREDVIAYLDDDNVMWPTWLEYALHFLEGDEETHVIYGAQLRAADAAVGRLGWFHEDFDADKLLNCNLIDLNQVAHRRSACRFNEKLKRLVDWDYLVRLIKGADKIAKVPTIASIYSTSASNRISIPGWPPDLYATTKAFVSGQKSEASSESKTCPCCGYVGSFLPGPNGRPDAGCPDCGSLERHRFLDLLIAPLFTSLPETRRERNNRLLEIAPSKATLHLRALFSETITVDSDPEADGRVVDLVASLTDLPIEASSCDVVVALHVLEHIPDDRQAMREIARVLRYTGIAIIQVPLDGRPVTDEEPLDTPEERLVRYGQRDHVRAYGSDLFDRLRDEGLAPVSVSPRDSLPGILIAKYALLPDQALIFAVRAEAAAANDSLVAFARSLRRGASIFENFQD